MRDGTLDVYPFPSDFEGLFKIHESNVRMSISVKLATIKRPDTEMIQLWCLFGEADSSKVNQTTNHTGTNRSHKLNVQMRSYEFKS